MEDLKILVRQAMSGMIACYIADKLTDRIAEYLYAKGVRVPEPENASAEVE